MHYRIEIIKNGKTAFTKDHEADNPHQAVNYVVGKTKIRPFYSIMTINENGDLWLYQVEPRRKGRFKIIKVAYERSVACGVKLNNFLAGNISLKRLVSWN